MEQPGLGDSIQNKDEAVISLRNASSGYARLDNLNSCGLGKAYGLDRPIPNALVLEGERK